MNRLAEAIEEVKSSQLSRGFLAGLRIDHGPIGLLGRYFLFVDHYLRARGVTLTLASLEDASRLHERNRQSWNLFPPMLDTRLSDIPKSRSYCLLGIDGNGAVVTSQGGQVFDLAGSSLTRLIKDQSFFYGPGGKPGPAQPTCDIWAPVADSITGQVVYSGALWVRPDYRGHKFASLLPRLSRAYALAHWGTDYTVAFISNQSAQTPLLQMYGYSKLEQGFLMAGIPGVGDVTGPLMWMDRAELADDLAAFLAHMLTKVDGAVGYGSTQDEPTVARVVEVQK